MNPLHFVAELWRGHQPVSSKRKLVALGIAGLTDLIQIVFLPLFWEGAASPFDVGLDILAALSLFVVLGFKWRFLAGLIVEVIPGLDLFPTWTALVLSLPSQQEPAGERPMKNVTPEPTESGELGARSEELEVRGEKLEVRSKEQG
jgi:hypothetical protein